MPEVIQALTSGVAQAFTWHALVSLTIGVLVGGLVGLLPGLGGAAMLAMLIPFAIPLAPIDAFALLLGAAAVTATTGDLSSIVLGVPGEPVSAALVVDGHELARRGEAGRALGAALASSFIGAAFGAIALAAIIPVARPLILSIGSPELFMLAIVGVVFVIPLVADAPLKGLAAGSLGLLLSTVGLDPIDARPRYTFDSLTLWDGIGIMPVTLGLFAIPEVLALAASRGQTRPETPSDRHGLAQGAREAVERWPLVLRCSAIGTYVGMLPGLGGSVAQWIAYAHARVRRPGGEAVPSIEGVLGPAAANNAALGGALIPTIVLGIPGSVTAAVLLSAFVLKGMIPGDTLLLPKARGGHLALVFSFVVLLVAANAIVVSICFALGQRISRIAEMRASLLFAPVLMLTFAGAFLERRAFADVALALSCGAVGWAMVRFDWPRPPLMLGLVLGSLAENRLLLSLNLYGADWWRRPGVLGIAAIVAAFAIYTIATSRRAGLFAPPAGPDLRGPAYGRSLETPSKPAAKTGDVVFAAALAALAAAALAAAFSFAPRANYLPMGSAGAVLLLALAQTLIALRRPAAIVARSAGPSAGIAGPAWIAAGAGAIWLLGFPVGAPLFALAYVRVGGRERWSVALVSALAMTALMEGVLKRGLMVTFPDGLLVSLLRSA